MAVTLEKIVDEIKALTPKQRQRVREMIDNAPTGETPEEELRWRKEEVYQRLRDKGIVIHIPLPITDPKPFDDWKPIKIEGKPLSEIIIEERR
jgi:hypothetical protein